MADGGRSDCRRPGTTGDHPAAADAGIEIVGDIELFCRGYTDRRDYRFQRAGHSRQWSAKAAGLIAGRWYIGLPALMLLMMRNCAELSSFQLETTSITGGI